MEETQPTGSPNVVTENQTKPSKSWLKIALFAGLGLVLVSGLVFAGYKLGQGQTQPASSSALIPTPKVTSSFKEKEEVRVRAADNGSQIIFVLGETLILTLESNPTTGYGWEIVGIDEAILKQTYHEYKSNQPIRPGSGGEDIWYFRSQTKGKTVLTLNYRRPWEKEKLVRTFRVEVVV